MTDLVPADQIEQIVGARRHPLAHLGRAVSAELTSSPDDTICNERGVPQSECPAYCPHGLTTPPGQTGGDR